MARQSELLKVSNEAYNQLVGCAAWLETCGQPLVAEGTREVAQRLQRILYDISTADRPDEISTSTTK